MPSFDPHPKPNNDTKAAPFDPNETQRIAIDSHKLAKKPEFVKRREESFPHYQKKISEALEYLVANGSVCLNNFPLGRFGNNFDAIPQSAYFTDSISIVRVLDRWHVVGQRTQEAPDLDNPILMAEWNALRKDYKLQHPIYTHNATRGNFDYEEHGGIGEKASILKPGDKIKLFEGLEFTLPDITFTNPFTKDTPPPQLEEPKGLFANAWKVIKTFRYPEVLDTKQINRLGTDHRDHGKLFEGGMNKYVAFFAGLNRLYQEATGRKLEMIDPDWIQKHTGIQTESPCVNLQRIALDRHRLQAARKLDIPIRVSWVDYESFN